MATWWLVYALLWLQLEYTLCLSTCCLELLNPKQLADSVEAEAVSRRDSFNSLDIVFTTFASENILSYAANIMLFNSVYFAQNRYEYRTLSERTGDDYFPADRRWNKIKAISNGLRTWARDSSFLVFMDADLIILNQKFDILSVISLNPSANIILATDAIDIANTGFIIVRNTPWSVDFFDRWWAAKDTKDTFCDQHVLNKLLEDPVDREFVAIVPAKLINSQWPVIDNFVTGDPVLHLMGETNEIRIAVSQYLTEAHCSQVVSKELDAAGGTSSSALRGVQLTKEKLVEIKQETLAALWEASKAACESEEATEADFDRLHKNVGHRCDPANRPGQPHALEMCAGMLREAMSIHQTHLTTRPKKQRVLHLNYLSMLQFDLLELRIAFTLNNSTLPPLGLQESVFEVAHQVLLTLESLEDSLEMRVPHNHAYIHHKRGMVFGQLGRFHQAAQQWDEAAEKERVCIEELRQALQVTPEGQEEFRAFVLSFIHAAARLAQALRELNRLREAEEWANIALNNAQLLYGTTSNEVRLRAAELGSLHMLCRSIYIDLREQTMVDLHTHALEVQSIK